MKKILGVLQNQWFPVHSIDRVQKQYGSASLQRKRVLTGRYLFQGCTSGRTLIKYLGKPLCCQIEWCNSSMEIASETSAKFKYDSLYVMSHIEDLCPDVIIAFGQEARKAVYAALLHEKTLRCVTVIVSVHPAARTTMADYVQIWRFLAL